MAALKLGLVLGYSGAEFAVDIDTIREAEALGFDSVWTSEAYGSDAVSPAAWVLAQTSTIKVGTAIMQMAARTPAATAMTAMTLQALSGGRFVLGIGASGPQVVEGWHGVPYGRPVSRIREYVAILRQILAREAPVRHDGYHYQLPYRKAGATGLGKPLKSILHGDPSLEIFTGSVTPAGVAAAAEIADGFFPVFMIPERFDVFEASLNEGFAKAGGGKSLERFQISPFVPVRLGDDLDACRRPIKEHLALYVGGMGARDKNFYTDYVTRLGFADAARRIQNLFLDGKRAEAVAAVPDDLVDGMALVGPPDRIADRLVAWKDAASKGRVSALLASDATPEAVRLLAEKVL